MPAVGEPSAPTPKLAEWLCAATAALLALGLATYVVVLEVVMDRPLGYTRHVITQVVLFAVAGTYSVASRRPMTHYFIGASCAVMALICVAPISARKEFLLDCWGVAHGDTIDQVEERMRRYQCDMTLAMEPTKGAVKIRVWRHSDLPNYDADRFYVTFTEGVVTSTVIWLD